MAGIRADVLGPSEQCTSIREGLPSGASAGIRCEPDSDLVASVAFYAFHDAADLLAAYGAAVTAGGLELRTELPDPGQAWDDCWRGFAWEQFYWPRGDTAGGMNRIGCYTDASGIAHLRYLWEVPGVYIEVVGTSGDIAALQAWSWYDAAGAEPAMGGPGLWQPETLPPGVPTN